MSHYPFEEDLEGRAGHTESWPVLRTNHCCHRTGEIDMIMPVTAQAKLDGGGAGSLVYGLGTGHRPTVRRSVPWSG